MTLAEKHKIKAEEKKLEKEEARAAFRLNQIKPTTNACFNILFVLLSFVCLFPVFYVFMISVSSTDSITKYGYGFSRIHIPRRRTRSFGMNAERFLIHS